MIRNTLPPPTRRRSDRTLETYPPESHHHADLVRRQGGIISLPRKFSVLSKLDGGGSSSGGGAQRKLTKLLLNVTVERSLGPVQVVLSPEKSVGDLIKMAMEIYGKEKRRPLLSETDPRRFELHYSPFSLESLKPEEKLINLGSRNFFLCAKRSNLNSSCSEEANQKTYSSFPMTNLMDYLL